jgi:hypothetical protein
MNRKFASTLIAATALLTAVLPAHAQEHESWINAETLAKDPRALCSDVGLGENKQNNHGSFSSYDRNATANRSSASGSNANSRSNSNSHNDRGSGSVSVFGIVSVGGGGGSQGSNASHSSNSSRYARATASSQSSANGRSSTYNRDSVTVVTGKNCDAFVEAAAARDIAHDNNQTAIKINDSNNQTAIELLNTQRRSGAVENLIRW